jgi:hypothetical protein
MLNLLRTMACVAVLLPAAAHATPIDLNLLVREPGAPISVTSDGSSATLGEDPSSPVVVLSNEPQFGDPVLITASEGAHLLFDYVFNLPATNHDVFHYTLLDGKSAPLSAFDFFVSDSGPGTASFDLSSLVGTTLGLLFDLIPVDTQFTSSVQISNLRIESPGATSVDEPQTFALLLICGLIVGGTVLRGRKRLTAY